MLGVYDFNGHYDWTFAWLLARGGERALRDYWVSAIAHDSQSHARDLFARGFEGMIAYWGHTLAEEGAGYTAAVHADPATGRRLLRIDMHDCPSKGFLLRNGLAFSPDYCDHCIGWIGPALAESGHTVDHEHDHRAHCWWEIRRSDDPTPASGPGEQVGGQDVRLRDDWARDTVDRFERAPGPEDKRPSE